MDRFHLYDVEIRSNKLIKNTVTHTFYIDTGRVTTFGDDYTFSLEETGIIVNNGFHGFKSELFQIYMGMVHYRGVVYHLNKQFVLNVTRGRIFIDGVCRHFTVVDNVMSINMTGTAANIVPQRRRVLATPIRPTRTPVAAPVSLAAVAADMQNTHNTKILDNLYNILVAVKNKTQLVLTFDQCVVEIRNLIYEEDTKRSIHDVSYGMIILNYIIQQYGYIDRFQMYENDVLTLIWNAVRGDNELKKIFYQNFLSMYERDAVVCLTGRVSRMVDIFSGIINIKTNLDQIRVEMMNKCVAIRNIMKTEDSEVLKEAIKKQMNKDYVESGILTKVECESELNEWIDDI